MPAVTYDIIVGSRPVQAQHGPLGGFFITLSGVVDVGFRHEPNDTDQTLHRQLLFGHEEYIPSLTPVNRISMAIKDLYTVGVFSVTSCAATATISWPKANIN